MSPSKEIRYLKDLLRTAQEMHLDKFKYGLDLITIEQGKKKLKELMQKKEKQNES